MRKIYTLFAVAIVAISMSASPVFSPLKAKSHNSSIKVKSKKKAAKMARTVNSVWKAQAAASIWRPGTQVLSEWDPETSEWVPSAKYETTYDAAGRILTDLVTPLDPEGMPAEEESAQRTTYQYNEFGMPVYRLIELSEDNEFTNYSRKVREYDPEVHSVITANTESLWLGDEWLDMGNCYRRVVTRNSLGNVTQVTIEVLYQGEYEATQKMVVEYGEDNKACRIVTSELTTDDGVNMYWVDEMEYKDIVWHHTNGQILNDDITSVDNGIASCVVMDNDGENMVTVDYPDNAGSYHSMLTYDNGSVEVTYNVVDGYGSYDYLTHEVYKEEGEEDYHYAETERLRKNEYGLETEIYMAASEDGEPEMVMEWTKGTIEEDAAHGYPKVFTVETMDPETEEFVYTHKIEFSDYADATGVHGVKADESAPVEFYTIDGLRTKALKSGVYIRRQGKNVTKVMK